MPRDSTRPPPGTSPPNIVLDAKTVAAMVRIYCRDLHGHAYGHLCDGCAALLEYADQRLAGCPFGPEKTTCRECRIHCYRPAERTAMKDVMRHAGPRMLWRHPWLTIRHLWIERQGPPPSPPVAGRRDATAARHMRVGLLQSRSRPEFFPHLRSIPQATGGGTCRAAKPATLARIWTGRRIAVRSPGKV